MLPPSLVNSALTHGATLPRLQILGSSIASAAAREPYPYCPAPILPSGTARKPRRRGLRQVRGAETLAAASRSREEVGDGGARTTVEPAVARKDWRAGISAPPPCGQVLMGFFFAGRSEGIGELLLHHDRQEWRAQRGRPASAPTEHPAAEGGAVASRDPVACVGPCTPADPRGTAHLPGSRQGACYCCGQSQVPNFLNQLVQQQRRSNWWNDDGSKKRRLIALKQGLAAEHETSGAGPSIIQYRPPVPEISNQAISVDGLFCAIPVQPVSSPSLAMPMDAETTSNNADTWFDKGTFYCLPRSM
jgi:hypothetical protein